jgi:DNA invertase Pin-like site-specific DNA recombinase
MGSEQGNKVTAGHLQRRAYLSIRQSTRRQGFENTESTRRQYALRDKALALGWASEQIHVIDSDLGKSGAERDRVGFQQRVTEVSLDRVGIVMSLEVSRLARHSTDGHRLLELCALTGTLILDEDGLYDPAPFNDRLILGLKGTMSEAELHVLRARLQGGIRNKARRGDLRLPPPVGFVYDPQSRLVFDPDQQVQDAVRLVCAMFARTGSACAVVKWFRHQQLRFPRRLHHGPQRGDLVWGDLSHSRVLHLLHNPRYAGAFVFGRMRVRRSLDGHTTVRPVPQEHWQVVLPAHHMGDITWETFEANQQALRDNAKARGLERKSPPREGPALLQGLVLCGRCGDRMTVRYTTVRGTLVPHYMCQQRRIAAGEPLCQHVPGANVDQAVGQLLLTAMTPLQLDVTLAVHQEIQTRLEEADARRRQHVERARYEADMARRRYLQVEPANRLVAATLEADWNEQLRALQAAQEAYERQGQTDRHLLDAQQQASIRALAVDFPRGWQDPKTSARDRKRLVRLLLEDVTLLQDQQVRVSLRFKGGATQTLHVPRRPSAWQLRQPPQPVLDTIDRLLEHATEDAIARQLNAQGVLSGTGQPFTARIVARLRRTYGLKSRYDRLRERGFLTAEELAQDLQVCVTTVHVWRRAGRLQAQLYNDKGEYLYAPLGDQRPLKYAWPQGQKQTAAPHS